MYGIFYGKQITIIGKFYKIKHKDIERLITSNGGKCTVNCSRNTSFIIVPNEVTNNIEKYKDNQQIIKGQNNGIYILSLNYILKCIELNKTLNMNDYIVSELNVKINDIKSSREIYVWIPSKKPYYYDPVLGLTDWYIPNKEGDDLCV